MIAHHPNADGTVRFWGEDKTIFVIATERLHSGYAPLAVCRSSLLSTFPGQRSFRDTRRFARPLPLSAYLLLGIV
jgi:hypothetical protein